MRNAAAMREICVKPRFITHPARLDFTQI